MQSREDLIKENIELAETAFKFKRGLHLAKKAIESHYSDESHEAYAAYDKFIEENGLEDL